MCRRSCAVTRGNSGVVGCSPSAARTRSAARWHRSTAPDNAGARTLTIWVGTEAQYTAIGTKDARSRSAGRLTSDHRGLA
ncbi:phage upper tail fiber protein [Rhodococcus sp. ENV425]|uniref:phage upper tail fiber protein n=1 Tax=Rhodococcus aetherivorans TaxID=191292 RepID=UPI0011AF9E36